MSESGRSGVTERPPLADKALSEGYTRLRYRDKALSEGYARLRYRDTSLLIWQQQQLELETGPPANYLSRSKSAWYSRYGNQAVVVRDKTGLEDGVSQRESGRSRICLIM